MCTSLSFSSTFVIDFLWTIMWVCLLVMQGEYRLLKLLSMLFMILYAMLISKKLRSILADNIIANKDGSDIRVIAIFYSLAWILQSCCIFWWSHTQYKNFPFQSKILML